MSGCRLALALALLGTPAAAQSYDVPWFQANPRARAQILRLCADDATRNRTPACENARAAEARGRGLGRPLPQAPTQFERELPAYLRRRT
ncbi:EexN family lipoprotein [Muricoccus radiodurans]|uniref:EexN family lipoprotein n=1 Tax=Muricoccus radiodurans TaxID=2231721 RepID=UPI003CEDDF6F